MYSSIAAALMSCSESCWISAGISYCSLARASDSDVKYTMPLPVITWTNLAASSILAIVPCPRGGAEPARERQ
jgi:hypothetical protein